MNKNSTKNNAICNHASNLSKASLQDPLQNAISSTFAKTNKQSKPLFRLKSTLKYAVPGGIFPLSPNPFATACSTGGHRRNWKAVC